MISTTQYEILCLIKNEQTDEILNHHVLSELVKEKMIEYTGAGIATLSSKGESAIEEFENALFQKKRGKYSLRISIFSLLFSGIAIIISFVNLFV